MNTNDVCKESPTHIMFCMVDHFEPRWNNPSYDTEVKRVDKWVNDFPKIASEFKDNSGRPFQYTFFYPEEEYRKEHIDKLKRISESGFGEIEIHLHHHNDTGEGLKRKVESFKENLSKHGLLSKDNEGNIRYGFIHGNWALDNSRGDDKWCGVNNELIILKETGCYADFTLPSAPDVSQTRKINSIYYAKDDPCKPKSHNDGVDVKVGGKPSGDLMIIQGPLALNWKRRKWGILPRIENGEISYSNNPIEDRIDLWIKQGIHVKGRPGWIFVKVYTHGTQEHNWDTLLGDPMRKMLSYLDEKYNDGMQYKLHYVTAREMYNTIKAAEDGMDGDPSKYRDYILKKRI
ncbi:MAG: hypothetical protein KAS99_04130 [Candidatus Omnitrophica bacterium]|nr:hypothetical protein [Candidatus Omnitrophota bacterium]